MLVDTKGNGPETREQAAFRKALQKVMGDSGPTKIKADSGADNVTIGSFYQKAIDPSDIQKYGTSQPSASSALLGHEIMEQYAGQVLGLGKDAAHAFGIQQENIFSGWSQGAQTGKRSSDGLIFINISFTRGASKVDVRATFDPRTDDITSVVRIPVP